MTTWLLAFLLLASLAGLGFRQGAVRVAFSLVGILLGVLLAVPLGKLVKPLLAAVGLKNPTLLWLLCPFLVFLLISIAFKIGALAMHQKVDVHYKYHAGELRLALWERLNRRLGLCLGLVNGAAYFIIISWIIYSFSYWTVQMATSDSDPAPVRILNRMGHDLHATGAAKVARAVDHLSPAYYDAADIAGLIYNNPLIEARLSRYPGILGLAERPEFQDLANDASFTEMRLKREPIMNVLNQPKAQAILHNPDLLHTIWATVVPDFKDLSVFLETGKSPKYDPEKILGRWNFNINAALAAYRKVKPNISASDMLQRKKWMQVAFAKTIFIATAEQQAILKNGPPLKAAAGAAPSGTIQGQWKDLDGGKYQLSFSEGGNPEEVAAVIEGDRLTIKGSGMDLVLDREE